MKTFITIYKTMLLWATVASFIFFILGLESMINEKRWELIAVWVFINALGYWLCKNMLTIRDLYKKSGTYYIERYLL